jgi:SNF2 family DNA or RNA helicase
MFVLHTHWRPSRRPTDPGGMLFWAETADAPPPEYLRGKLPKKHPPKQHPFCLESQELRGFLGEGTPLDAALAEPSKLMLPSTRTGPIPSPDMGYNWQLDTETPAFLAPWLLDGLWLDASKAFGVLVNLPTSSREGNYSLGQDALYWRNAANLVLEILASQNIVPVLVPVKGNGSYQARWQPVLDGPEDGGRLARLAAAMPPICRAELLHPNGRYNMGIERPAQVQLDGFLNAMTDALVRSWGKSASPYFQADDDHPFHAWLTSLFQEDATVEASTAQLEALDSSLRAWVRNLSVSGDATFRIAFRLEAPAASDDPTAGPKNGLSEDGQWTMHYLLQARDEPNLVISAEEIWRSGNSLERMGRHFEQPQEKLLAGLGYAARLFPPLTPSLNTSQPMMTTMSTELAYSFLRETAPVFEQAGFGLLPPPWWNQASARLGVRLRLRPIDNEGKVNLVSGKLGLNKLVEYQWELALGDTTLTREEFDALAEMNSPLVQIRGQWVQLDAEQIEAAIQFWETKKQSGRMSLLEAAQYGLDGEGDSTSLPLTEVVAEDWMSEWLDSLAHHERMTQLLQPEGMQGELRPYQLYGYSWLAFFRRWGLGACLADDMGLGKTIQTLALLQYEKENQQLLGPVLLVCPTSVVTNWRREAKRFTPDLVTAVHQGANRWRNESFLEKVKDVDLVLTSYAVIRQDIDLLKQVSWHAVILDEAQNIKNPSAKQTQAVRSLSANYRLALTGTPVENRLSELWSIMHFLNPGLLSTRESFRRHFGIPIERFGDPEATSRLRSLISPFILRRMKTDPNVIQDLPEKIERKEYCHLNEEQAALYEAIVRDTMEEVTESEGMARRGLVLRLLMQLKQVCNHPTQYLHEVDAALANRKQLVGRSGKLERLIQMLEEILPSGDRILIYTQFAEMGKLLSAYIPHALGRTVQFLYGETSLDQRERMVRRFQEDEHGPQIFILSLKAGGTGLNLMRASHVFHFDRWWNPAVEDQATDRAYRIGQSKNVQVHKFITAGTLEERIDEMIESKKGLAEAIIGSGEQWLTELSTEELRQLVELRQE